MKVRALLVFISQALNDHKRVVTAHWLNDVIAKGRMEPPWRAHHLPHPHVAEKLPCADQVGSIYLHSA